VQYTDCAVSPLGNWCQVRRDCNGAHSSSGDNALGMWIECTEEDK